jgi:hypothetical protein
MIVLQILGSLAILCAFGLAQAGRISTRGLTYLVVNALGAVALGLPAVVTGQWGFVLLEAAWLLISLYGLVRRPRPTPAHPH